MSSSFIRSFVRSFVLSSVGEDRKEQHRCRKRGTTTGITGEKGINMEETEKRRRKEERKKEICGAL
jgi:hypothetical protein